MPNGVKTENMKRITLVAALTLLSLATFAQVQTVPYASTFGERGEGGWTVTTFNGDYLKWTVSDGSAYGGSGYGSGVYLQGPMYNDWIISPAISLEANTEYVVRFMHKRNNTYKELNAVLYAATGSDVNSLAADSVVADFSNSTNEWSRSAQKFAPAESGDYHFGFYAKSGAAFGNCTLYLTGFEVMKLAPKPVSDLVLTLGADFAVEATLSWKLPTKWMGELAFDDKDTFNAVYVYRDGVLAQTLPGNATTWTDSEASGMTAAEHTYEVEVEVNGLRSPRSCISYAPPRTLPYLSDFNDGGWAIIDVGNDGKTWHIQDNKHILEDYDRGVTCDHQGLSYNGDDWLISPPLPMTAGVEYTVKFKYRNGEHLSKGPLSLYASTQNTIGGLTSGIKIIANVPAFLESTDALYTFTATESDYYYLGFCARTDRLPIYMTGLEVTNPSITGVAEAAADGSIRRVGDTVIIPDVAADIMLVTVSGQVVRRCAAADSIDLSPLAPGVYIVSCNVGGKLVCLKIMK